MQPRITAALTAWSRSTTAKSMSPDDMEIVQRTISPGFNLTPSLARKVEEQEEQLFRLTTDQKNLLYFLGETQRACVEGVAGSGKTLLALAKAEMFADEGKRTLLVCYNKTLAAYIRAIKPYIN